MIRAVLALLICLAAGPCQAAECVFFAGEDHEVTIALGVRDGCLVSTLGAVGIPPDPYIGPGELRQFIEARTVTHLFAANDIPMAVGQELTVQWAGNGQVMQTWAQSATVTVAMTRWRLLHVYIDAGRVQSVKAGQAYVFTIVPSWSDVELVAGDVNLSGTVDDNDLSVLLSCWGWGRRWSTGELTGDETVDDNDLSVVLSNWGAHGSQPSIPEPAALAIVLVGCLIIRKRAAERKEQ